jgi:hypothetical protein
VGSLGFGPPPEGFRLVRYGEDGTARGDLDRVEEARAARQKEGSKPRERSEARQDLTAPLGSDVPVDIFDIALAQLATDESWRIRNKELSLDTLEKRAQRTEEWRETQQAKTRATLDAIEKARETKKDSDLFPDSLSEEEIDNLDDDEWEDPGTPTTKLSEVSRNERRPRCPSGSRRRESQCGKRETLRRSLVGSWDIPECTPATTLSALTPKRVYGAASFAGRRKVANRGPYHLSGRRCPSSSSRPRLSCAGERRPQTFARSASERCSASRRFR